MAWLDAIGLDLRLVCLIDPLTRFRREIDHLPAAIRLEFETIGVETKIYMR